MFGCLSYNSEFHMQQQGSHTGYPGLSLTDFLLTSRSSPRLTTSVISSGLSGKLHTTIPNETSHPYKSVTRTSHLKALLGTTCLSDDHNHQTAPFVVLVVNTSWSGKLARRKTLSETLYWHISMIENHRSTYRNVNTPN